ncbi:hypothetical protein FO519_006040 [Halicephalobus sp. NKZ332]|nr:hypothetical protein FO519_006040 [Halicephalobus sp. NKZ332]
MTCISYWLILILVCVHLERTNSKRRWKRQSLPSDNVQVHSFDSNVTIADQVEVSSSDSRIELFEANFGSAIWSDSSFLRFNPNDEYVNLTAQQVIARFNLKSAQFHCFAQSLQLNETTNRRTDGETQLGLTLTNAVNLSLSDVATTTQVEAVNGRSASVTANTWSTQVERKLTVASSVTHDTSRKLVITSVSNEYNIVITLDGAQVGLLYGNVRLDIAPDYRTLVLLTERHRVELRTVYSPFDLTITDADLLVRAPDDSTVLRIRPNSSDVDINVNQLSRMTMDRFEGGTLLMQGQPVVAGTEEVVLDSRELALNLIAGSSSENTAIHSSSNFSQLTMRTNLTKASLVAGHHFIQILGGTPHLLLLTGNISLDISGNTNPISTAKLLPQFTEPPDQFNNIGPFGNGTSLPSYPNEGIGDSEEPNVSSNVKPNQGTDSMGNQTPGGTNIIPTQPGLNLTLITPSTVQNGSEIIPPGLVSPETNFPTPQPGEFSNLTGSSQIDGPVNPNEIETDFPEPIEPFPPPGTNLSNQSNSSNFIIGQYGTEPPPPVIEGFPISATITNIDVIHDIPDDFPTPPATITPENSTATFLISTSAPLRLRDDVKRGLMQLNLRVQRSTEVNATSFINDMEDKLTDLVSKVFFNQTGDEKTRTKRMLQEVDVKINDVTRDEEDPENVMIQFYVDKPDYFRDLPFLTTKLNSFGHEMLSEKLKYKVISSIEIEKGIGLGVVLAVVCAAGVLLLIIILMAWRFTSKEQTFLKYLKRWKVEDIPENMTV